MFVARLSSEDTNQEPKRARVERPLVMGFSDKDKIGTIQPHDDALVITLRIEGYNVKREMVDQDSAAEIMYPDLYRGLSLRAEDLTPYSSPLVSFEGKVIIPRGHIRLPVQTGSETVEVDFNAVDAYSPYTLPGLSSDTFGLRQLGKNGFCYPYWELSLQSNAIRVEERRIHLSKNDDKDVRVAIGEKYRDLYR